jgi:hypothetical protein
MPSQFVRYEAELAFFLLQSKDTYLTENQNLHSPLLRV